MLRRWIARSEKRGGGNVWSGVVPKLSGLLSQQDDQEMVQLQGSYYSEATI